MFGTLLESRPAKYSQHRYTIGSVVAHAGLIAGAAIVTAGPGPGVPVEPPRVEVVTFQRPPSPAPVTAPTPSGGASGGSEPIIDEAPRPVIRIHLDRIPVGMPPGDPVGDSILAAAMDALRQPRGGGPGARGGEAGGGTSTVYTSMQVEQVAALDRAVAPTYPPSLRSAGITGVVRVRLVVDEEGRVVPGSVLVRESSHDRFTAAVEAVLPRLRFRPAMLDGKPVAQLVELPFHFTMDR